MRDREPPLVALYGRGRELAYAVFEHGDLVRFGVKTIRGRRSGKAFQKTILRAITAIFRRVDRPLVVIERMDPRQRHGGLSRALPSVVASIVSPPRIGTARLSDAKRHFCRDPHATHDALRAEMTDRYPVLRTASLTARTPASLAAALGDTALHRRHDL